MRLLPYRNRLSYYLWYPAKPNVIDTADLAQKTCSDISLVYPKVCA
jgi:hypothetical protein